MSRPRILCLVFLSMFLVRAGSAQTIQNRISGAILSSTNDVMTSATGTASHGTVGAAIANHIQTVRFAPTSPTSWYDFGATVFADSSGTFSYRDNRGVPEYFTSDGAVFGTEPAQAMGGGSLALHSDSLLLGTLPNEFRFRVLNQEGVIVSQNGYQASSQLTQGRMDVQGAMVFTPPGAKTKGGWLGTYAPYKADLVIELRWGCDGYSDIRPNAAWYPARQMDLDIIVNPQLMSDFFGSTYWDGTQAVRVRAQGMMKTAPMGTSWPSTQPLSQSTLTIDNKQKGTPTDTRTINWGNVPINVSGAGPRVTVNSWQSITLPAIPLEFRAPTTIRVQALTQNKNNMVMGMAGKIQMPGTSAEAPSNPTIGNGVEVRMRLINVSPL